MKSLWDDDEARAFEGDPVAMRAYSSRLLGRERALVLHGGGNTSVKVRTTDFYGDEVEALYVKGSGWDLATIEPRGFAPVKMQALLRMAEMEALSDVDMVREQRAAMLDPGAPDPSIEAILHALLPFRFVDHTHADSVVAVSNTPGGEERIRGIYGDRVLVVPYVMPGFVLARKVREVAAGADWARLEGMVLMSHGIFSFGETAKEAYERMIALVTRAEDHLRAAGAWDAPDMALAPAGAVESAGAAVDLVLTARLRKAVSDAAGKAMTAKVDDEAEARGFASRADVADLAARGPVTPDHVIRTKSFPLVLAGGASGDPEIEVAAWAERYRETFARHDDGTLTCLDPAPRFVVVPGLGIVSFGTSEKAAGEVADIARSTARVAQQAEALGGWRPLGEDELFPVEYWELEQRKLKKGGAALPLQGKVALVTGGAGGIGRATAEELRRQGAAVAVLDLSPSVVETFRGPGALGIAADVTDPAAVERAVAATVRRFGGLDLLVSNAGDFPPSQDLDAIDDAAWLRCLDLNLNSHMRVLRAAVPFLSLGVEPAVVFVASRNVPAPGPGVAAYSASKAALTQLARVAALELGPAGVRVNVLHPDKVFDTALWSPEKLEARAAHYEQSVDEYRRSNLLQVEVASADVARLAAALLGPLFRCTTGAQIPVDGGNERVV